jgi:Arc/MetJ-type ribon-helix-helix transcriptional regulator
MITIDRSVLEQALEEMSCANFNSASERIRHALREALAQPAAQPTDCLYINEGSADEAAITYEAEYWAEMAQGKADADTRRGAVQRVGYYVRDAILRMQAQTPRPAAQQEPAGEPVAWMPKTWTERYVSGVEAVTCYLRPTTGWVPLYTRPAVPLSDERIDRAIAELGLNYLADAANNRAVLRELCRKAAKKIGGAE